MAFCKNLKKKIHITHWPYMRKFPIPILTVSKQICTLVVQLFLFLYQFQIFKE